MKTFDTLDELIALVGQDITTTDWFTVTQQNINQFADATGDHQWIHVDPERAKAGPFGTTIAHGYMTLSLLAGFFDRSIAIKDVRMGINYGLNKVRFMAPVPSGSRLRAQVKLLSSTPIEGGVQMAWQCTIECEGLDKPVCVAEPLSRYYR
ncbi:MaoC family dehydratase [Ottowia thiooxydans]|uniref:Acyl dehydratase n=1 Tax=Ottowia thiooxydans TaxID=219182 RepID=A0ABV2QEC2_9BURK